MITCKSDHRDLRIYVNNLIHIHIEKKEYMMFQTYFTGDLKRIYHIEFICKDNTKLHTEYDDFEIWKSILQLLDKNI